MSPPSLGALLAGKVVAAVEAPGTPPPAGAPPAPPPGPFTPAGPTWHVRFADGAVLAVRTDGSPVRVPAAPGAAVVGVRQHGTALTVLLAGGAALAFRTAEESGCVLLRDGAGRMAYAD